MNAAAAPVILIVDYFARCRSSRCGTDAQKCCWDSTFIHLPLTFGALDASLARCTWCNHGAHVLVYSLMIALMQGDGATHVYG
jgi:hypothetical protein